MENKKQAQLLKEFQLEFDRILLSNIQLTCLGVYCSQNSLQIDSRNLLHYVNFHRSWTANLSCIRDSRIDMTYGGD